MFEQLKYFYEMTDISVISFFVIATSQSPGLPETLATAYNPGMCLLALPVIVYSSSSKVS